MFLELKSTILEYINMYHTLYPPPHKHDGNTQLLYVKTLKALNTPFKEINDQYD